jgi:hypothetical protein
MHNFWLAHLVSSNMTVRAPAGGEKEKKGNASGGSKSKAKGNAQLNKVMFFHVIGINLLDTADPSYA